ncbi:hypothetical protein [Intrasporangium calvum]|nr:hypothetical protein [Intrasporangium calvum]
MGTAVAAEPAPSRGQTVAKGTPVNGPGSEDPNVPVGGPAPDWFKDSAYRPEQPIPTDQDGEGEGTDPNISVGGPAPDWFKDPSFRNFICSIALEAFLVSKVKPAWQLIRAVRWGI